MAAVGPIGTAATKQSSSCRGPSKSERGRKGRDLANGLPKLANLRSEAIRARRLQRPAPAATKAGGGEVIRAVFCGGAERIKKLR